MRSELMASQQSFIHSNDNSGEFTSYTDISNMLSNAVANRQFDEAISIVRSYKENHPNLSNGKEKPEEELETILSIYARSMLQSRSGVFALLGSYDQLAALCDKLNELLADFLSSAYERDQFRPDTTDTVKKELSPI